MLSKNLLKASFTSTTIKLAGTALAFIFFAIYSNILEQSEYGLFAIGFSTATIIATIIGFGQEFMVLRFWPKMEVRYNKHIADHVIKTGLKRITVGSLILLCLAAFYLTLSPFPNLTDSNLFFIASIYTLTISMTFAEFLSSSLRAKGHVAVALIPRDIIWRISTIFIVLVIPFQTAHSALFASSILLSLTTFYQWSKLSLHRQDNIEKEIANVIKLETSNASKGLWGISVSNALSQNITTVAIGASLGATEAAGFFVATKLSQLMAIFLTATNQAFGPMLSRAWQKGQLTEVRKLFVTAVAFSSIGALLVFLTFISFGKLALELFGSGYEEYYLVLIVLALGQLINAASGPNRASLMMIGKQVELLYIVLISAILLPSVLFALSNVMTSELASWIVTINITLLNTSTLLILLRNFRYRINKNDN